MSEKELETVKVIPGDYIIIEWNSDGGNGHYDNEFEVKHGPQI